MPKNSTPINYTYSDTFNYAQWNESTVLTLTNVNWNSDYRDVVRFANQAALDTWIDSQSGSLEITKMSLLKFGQNVRINTPLNAAMNYNYARASNPQMPVTGDVQRNYYYFVTDYRYINPNTTELVLQLDVWQTFGYEVTFGNSYIERGHIGIANTHAFDNYGRDNLTVAEGLDIGAEYQIAHVENTKIMDASDFTSGFSVLVISAVALEEDPYNGTQPTLVAAHGSVFEGMISGAGAYIFTPENFLLFMSSRAHLPWVTQGILSVTMIPKITRYHPGFDDSGTMSTYTDSQAAIIPFVSAPGGTPTPKTNAVLSNWRSNSALTDLLGQYASLKKFFTFPYMMVELTTFSGSPLVIKPEFWQDANATVNEIAAFMPPGQRVVFAPKGYNTSGEAESDTDFPNDDYGEYLDFATALDNFPQAPVVNNMALSYLASNKNGIQFQFTNADWSQQKALRGASATESIANADIANQARQSGISNTAQTAAMQAQLAAQMNNMMVNSIGGGAGVLGSMASGNMEDALGGLVDMATGPMIASNNAAATLAQNNISTAARGASTSSSIQAAGTVRDTNVGLARFAAKGDYQNEVKGIQAKIRDAQMIQPSTSGQFGGDAFNIINGNFGYSLRWKIISPNAIKTIGNFWLRYGYAVEQFSKIPSNFMCMTKFTYWKLTETYISQATIPEMFKQAIRGIFEKGVTVWGDPSYIGNTSLFDNQPLSGITIAQP